MPTPSAQKSPERLHHVDLLRGALMFLGVLVHASHADYDDGSYAWIRFLSESFRMACFFLISGYFAPYLLERDGTRGFLLKRWVTLGVPALFCVLVLNPRALSALRAYYATAPVPVEHAINWHLHVWFLFVLCLHALALPSLWRLVLWVDRDDSSRALRQGTFLAGLVAVAMLALKALEKWGPQLPGFSDYEQILEPAVQYLPYFAFGLLMRRSPGCFAFTHARPAAWGMTALALIGGRYLLEQQAITTTPQHLLHLTVDFATAFACSFALLGLVQRAVREPRRWVQRLSESAYTVYLVHFSLIAESLRLTQRWGLSMPLRMLTAAAIAFAGGLAVHFWLVKRFPVAALLLNGRLPTRRAAAERSRTPEKSYERTSVIPPASLLTPSGAPAGGVNAPRE
jgi:glucans biosynthesis protein C